MKTETPRRVSGAGPAANRSVWTTAPRGPRYSPSMILAALVFAGLAALLHVYIWTMESLTWRKPATWKRFGVATQEDAETQALFAFNQGFYNLFLAIIALVGIACI